MNLRLDGKNILITGVSRMTGIGAGLAKALAEQGATVLVHGYAAYDAKQSYVDAKEDYVRELVAELRGKGYTCHVLTPCDLSVPGSGARVIVEALEYVPHLDGLVLNHAYSTFCPIGQWTEEDINMHLLTNVTAGMMMIQEFQRQKPAGVRGAITLFTSGQYLGPMTTEIPYAVSKEAIIGLCKQASAALAKDNIQVNCINPGPVDTSYAFGETYEKIAKRFPSGRWGMPSDVAKLVHFLQSDYSAWITGEVIASEGGFRRDHDDHADED